MEFVRAIDDIPGVERQLGVEHTTLDRELFQEQLQSITTIDVVDEDDAFTLDELKFENDVGQQELVDFGAAANTCFVSSLTTSTVSPAYRTEYCVRFAASSSSSSSLSIA